MTEPLRQIHFMHEHPEGCRYLHYSPKSLNYHLTVAEVAWCEEKFAKEIEFVWAEEKRWDDLRKRFVAEISLGSDASTLVTTVRDWIVEHLAAQDVRVRQETREQVAAEILAQVDETEGLLPDETVTGRSIRLIKAEGMKSAADIVLGGQEGS